MPRGVYEHAPLADRFWSKVDRRSTDECWAWLGSKTDRGYGLLGFFVDGARTTQRAHRVSYELNVGPIPEGLTIDHLCRNTSCVNPAHLEAVTMRENILRGTSFSAVNAAKTRCIHGHDLTPENVYTRPNGCRQCRECARVMRRRYEASKHFATQKEGD